MQINGLSILVESELGRDPFASCVYGFINRARNRVKLLYWNQNGYCLFLKRIEKHRFVWPSVSEDDVMSITSEQLDWLLGGYDVFRFPPHERVFYQAIS
jgi:transposase